MRKNGSAPLKVKGARKFIKGLAFALAFTSIVGSTNISRVPVTTDNKTIEHDHEHDCDFDVETITYEVETSYAPKTIEVKEFTLEETKKDTIDISSYNGGSIVEALASNGYDSSFASRKKLASTLGIDNYKGTAEQNITMLNLLKGNVEIASETKVSVSDMAWYLASLEGKTFKNKNEAYTWAVRNNLVSGKSNYNINKQDLCNILVNYAIYKGVDMSSIDAKLGKIVNIFGDKDIKTNNINNLARAYYFGYIDVDSLNNVNASKAISVSDINYAFSNLITDINIAIKNNSYNKNNQIVIKPNIDKVSRDSKDGTDINAIRGDDVVGKEPTTPTTPATPSQPEPSNHPQNPEPTNPIHVHNYSSWKSINDENEQRECSSCHAKQTRKHSYSNWTIVGDKQERTCKTCGHKMVRDYTCEHTYGSWSYLNDDSEQRECSTCHTKETRGHNKPASTITYIKNNDGTHKKKSVQVCTTCHHDFGTIISDSIDCSFSSWEVDPNNASKEVRECSDCHYKEVRDKVCAHTWGTWTSKDDDKEERECSKCHEKEERNHTYGTPSTSYTYSSNDKHTEKKTAECSTCHHEKIVSETTKDCNYGAWEQNGSTGCKAVCDDCNHTKTKSHNMGSMNITANGNETHNEQGTCADCGYEINRNVACTSDGVYVYNSSSGVEEAHCTHCQGIADVRSHSHNWSSWVALDDSLEERRCSTSGCSEEETRAHSYGDPVYGADGISYSMTCSSCGHTKNVSHVHSTTERTETNPNPSSSGYCYKKITYCTVDGCTYEISETIDHDWVLYDEDDEFESYRCSHCSGTKEIEKAVGFGLLMACNLPEEEETEEVIEEVNETEEINITEEQYNEIVEEVIGEIIEEIQEEVVEEKTPQEEQPKTLELTNE